MRFLPIVLLALMSGPASATPCTLTPADFESLQLSRSGIKDQAQADAQPQDRQNLMCSTRTKWARIRNGTLQGQDLLKGVSVYFLSPKEGETFVKLRDAYLRAQLENVSDAEWQRTRQKLIEGVKGK